ncbi:hypothetical protein ACWDSD_21805 [Streptomyces spiralis]
MAWTWSPALVDGWQRGIARRLVETGEYLTQLHRFEDFGPALHTRTDHILIDSPTAAPDHAHRGPPGRRGC